tara:strand:- start:2726 stop:2932 length:207 start_codon:yes stop_codon:yes gene_type:complete
MDEVNEVEEYLKKNINKMIAVNNIYRDLSMKRRKALWLINQSPNIRKVNPLEVGSGKYHVHVYTYNKT